MMTSITPVGEMSRGQRWWLTAAAYVTGSVVGGGAVGALLGVVSVGVAALVPLRWRLLLLAAVAVVGLAVEWSGRDLPSRRRQVDERWLTTYRGWVYGFGFGLQLGAGLTTIITSSATHVVLAASLLSGSVAGGALVGAVFGLVRAMPVLAFATVRSAAALRAAMMRVSRLAAPVQRITAAAQGAVAVAAVVLAVRVGA